jgi:hypothetical protein
VSEEPDETANERRYERFASQLDLRLYEGSAALDEVARAVDVSAAGFRAVTRAQLREGQVLGFELVVGDGDVVRGQGKVVWVEQDRFVFDSVNAGVKITKISWRDSSRLRKSVYTPGYDFVKLARTMFWAFYWIIVTYAVQNVVFHQKTAREMVWHLLPIAGALAALGFSLFALLG